jgi:type IV secretion system protein TrbL
MRPGRVAQTGLDAARPLLESISNLMGWIAFFENFIQIACLLFAWALVLLAFFILAIQLFITLIEFKLTTLAGFVLIPFGLFGNTAFMAERVLGNVISSGIKVLVLAVIIGIGSTLFSQFTAGFGGQPPTIDDAMVVVLAACTFAVSASSVLVLPTALFPAARNSSQAPPSAPASSRAAQPWLLAARPGSPCAVARAPFPAALLPCAVEPPRRVPPPPPTVSAPSVSRAPPASRRASAASHERPAAWAQRMRRGQTMSHGVTLAAHAIRSGDSHGGGSSINLSGGDRT